MTALQLQQALTRLGMTQATLSRLTETNRRTVTRWASGESDVPAAIAMLLYLMLDTGTAPEQLRISPSRPPLNARKPDHADQNSEADKN